LARPSGLRRFSAFARSDGTISRVNMAMMGVIGAVAGASTAGIVGILRSMAEMWLPRIAANTEHKHQMIANLQSQRAEAVMRWRAGLAGAGTCTAGGLPDLATMMRPTW
jgi:hypothetical protein